MGFREWWGHWREGAAQVPTQLGRKEGAGNRRAVCVFFLGGVYFGVVRKRQQYAGYL